MQNIYLIRHGEKQLTPPDPELTQKGFQQALKTGIFFKNFKNLSIISSPLTRTKQTAAEIAKQLNLNFTCNKFLRERINFGDDPTQKKEDFLTDWELTTKDRFYIPSVGESSEQTGKRMSHFIRSLPKTNENIVLISHGGAIADFLRTTFGDEKIFSYLFDQENKREFHVKHCSITHLYRDLDKFLIKNVNSIDHL